MPLIPLLYFYFSRRERAATQAASSDLGSQCASALKTKKEARSASAGGGVCRAQAHSARPWSFWPSPGQIQLRLCRETVRFGVLRVAFTECPSVRARPRSRGGSLRAELAMSLVLHRIPGIGSPRGFIRFSRCLFWRSPVRSGFERAFAHGRARAAIERHNSLKLPHKKSFSQKRWQFQVIRSPGHRSACCMPLHSNEARTHRYPSKHVFRRFVEKPEAH